MIDLHLPTEQQIMWTHLRPVWTRELPDWRDWRGTGYEQAITSIHSSLQDLFNRPLTLGGAVEDSYELATVTLPTEAGGYPTFDPDSGYATPEAIAYSKAPAIVTFSALGPLATIEDDVHLAPLLHSKVLALLQQHGIDFVPFAATQARLPKDIWSYDAYPHIWFEACFTYV